jgi:hypothetical protein
MLYTKEAQRTATGVEIQPAYPAAQDWGRPIRYASQKKRHGGLYATSEGTLRRSGLLRFGWAYIVELQGDGTIPNGKIEAYRRSSQGG